MNIYKPILLAIFSFVFGIGASANTKAIKDAKKFDQDVQTEILKSTAKRMALIKSPSELVKALSASISAEDQKYLLKLIADGVWTHVPKVQAEGSRLMVEVKSDVYIGLRIEDYWKRKLAIEDYPLDLNSRKNLKDKVEYLRRSIKHVIRSKTGENYSLIEQIYQLFAGQPAHAGTQSLWEKINLYFSGENVEVSTAVTLWAAEFTSSEELRKCLGTDTYGGDQWTCLDSQSQSSQSLRAIRDIGVLLAKSPNTQLEIECSGKNFKRQPGIPLIRMNGKEVYVEDLKTYTEGHNVVPKELEGITAAAISCCNPSSTDPLRGRCEDFVTSHLGNADSRKKFYGGKAFEDTKLVIEGQEAKGIK